MKLTKIIAAVLCIAAVATACQQPFEEPMEQHGKAINLAVDVDNYTKATDTAFEEGDEIGLHIVPSGVYLNNAKYTYTAGALVSEQTNYWYMDETTESKIFAYYPYNENGTYRAAGYTFTVNADQSKEGGYTASDLMVAYTTSKPTAEAIELPFRHALSKIVIKIDNQLEEAIEDVYFSDIYGTATVRFDEVASTVSGSKGTIKTAKVVMGEGAEGEEVYSLIVVPQENVSPKLIIKTATKQYTYQLAGNITFSSGKVSTAAITVSDESISTAFTPTISDWVGDNDLQFGQGEDYPGGGNDDDDNTGSVVTNGTLYLHPGVWASDAPWYAAYFFSTAGDQVTMTMSDNDADGVFECGVPEGMESVIFCRMNPEFTEFGWNKWENEEIVEVHVWNQTEDLAIGVEPDNHFFVTSWDKGVDGKSGGVWAPADFVYEPELGSGLGVVGSFAASGWNVDISLVGTDVDGLLVAEGIEFRAYDAFKIRTVGTWVGEVNLGSGEINYFKANTFFGLYAGGGDIIVEAAGTYDIYFDQNATKVYLMTAGEDYTTATEQTTNGTAPDLSTMSWGLVGVHNDWASGDTALVWDGTLGLYVAKEVTLGAEFKVRADESWTTNYGGAAITVDKASATTLTYNATTNCTITAGTYDVYFWHDTDNIKANAKIWVKTVGSAAPSL